MNKDIGRLIGKKIKIEKSGNKCLVGIEGEITDETRNTISVKTEKGTKKIIKKQIK